MNSLHTIRTSMAFNAEITPMFRNQYDTAQSLQNSSK